MLRDGTVQLESERGGNKMMSKTDKAFPFAMVHSTKRNKKQQQTMPQT
jgi:hypothetical protein